MDFINYPIKIMAKYVKVYHKTRTMSHKWENLQIKSVKF